MKHFTHKEILDGSNMYKCEKCRRQTRATKSLRIHRPPNVLAISLKRFNVFGNKIGRQIMFPQKLNLANYCSNSKVDHHYELYASLVHDGHTVNSGHYYSYCKTPRGNWCRYVPKFHNMKFISFDVLLSKIFIYLNSRILKYFIDMMILV